MTDTTQAQSEALRALVREAFECGFVAMETYNDKALNTVEEAWSKNADLADRAAALAHPPQPEAQPAATHSPADSVLVPRATLLRWKEKANSTAASSLKAERYAHGVALKQEIADTLAQQPAPSAEPIGHVFGHAITKIGTYHPGACPSGWKDMPNVFPVYGGAAWREALTEVEAKELLNKFAMACGFGDAEERKRTAAPLLEHLTGTPTAVRTKVFRREHFDARSFFAAVARAMELRSVDAKQLSEATGISETTLSRMRSGERACDAASLAALSAWAGINPANHCAPTLPAQPEGRDTPQAEPVAYLRNFTDPQPHAVTALKYRTAADADAGVEYLPVFAGPQAERKALRELTGYEVEAACRPLYANAAAACMGSLDDRATAKRVIEKFCEVNGIGQPAADGERP